MKAVLLRTSSAPVQSWIGAGSPRVIRAVHDPSAGVFFSEKKSVVSPRVSLQLEINRGRDHPAARSIRRASSENESASRLRRIGGAGSGSVTARIQEHRVDEDDDEGRSVVLRSRASDSVNYAANWTEIGIPLHELGFGGCGSGGGGSGGGEVRSGSYGGGNADKSKIGAYYRQMLKANPGDFLLLRNYGRFLHEVEKDAVRAEEYYGRAILASPGDGEVLSLYGKLIWETQSDEGRAKSYFEQAVHLAPDDCMVLGSYAHFMWEAGEEEGGDQEDGGDQIGRQAEAPSTMIEAF
ncbi:uncharacterized protein LOC131164118 [Malania oleifera]|uniref:uncharacterized protein LOC131164118 n=1 Tax=Malania oleifera TaxID=397392 RepID=UPI0025ADB7F0|nr:uncharacterized protein LOC131164118 [Malania oleifera]